MAQKKIAKTLPKGAKVAKPPTLSERITDFSTNSHGPVRWVPKKKKK